MEKQWSDEEFAAECLRRRVKDAKEHLANEETADMRFMGVGLEHFTAEELRKIVSHAHRQADFLSSR